MVQRKLNSVRHPRIFWNFWRGKLAPRSQDRGSGAATLEPKIRNLPVLIGSFVTFKGQLTESARVKCPARRMNGVGFNWPEIDLSRVCPTSMSTMALLHPSSCTFPSSPSVVLPSKQCQHKHVCVLPLHFPKRIS